MSETSMSAGLPALKVLPVIHALDVPQCMRNAEIAFDAGADGVFLIQMDGQDEDLELFAVHLKGRWPERFIGVNFLSRGPLEALERSLKLELDATWTDKPGVSGSGVSPQAQMVGARLMENPSHLFFGSVAFKYQAPEPLPVQAAWNAQSLGMIPTTSGEATGRAPDAQKLKAMRCGLGSGPLALASGLTASNVNALGPYLTHLLVATGVSRDFHNFDEALLRGFVEAAKSVRRRA